MRTRLSPRRSLAALVLVTCVWLLWPAQSLAAALVRFIHAVPGVGTATVDVNSGSGLQTVGSIGFGQVTPFKSVRAGSFRWTLKGAGKVLATGTSTVGNGVYDIAILANTSGSGVKLGIYKASGARAGMSLVRMIHAAPELGAPMFMLNQQTMANRLPYTQATPYYSITPGVYSLSAMKPWLMKPGDPTLLDAKQVRFAPGAAYTAIAVGSRGQRVRVVRVVDRGAPLMRPVSLTKKMGKSGSMSKSGSAAKSGSMSKSGSTAKSGSTSGSSMSHSGSVMVQSGDSLWSIAQRIVGPAATDAEVHSKLVAIWDMNVKRIGTGDPNLIFPGQRLMLPA
jgi:Domain of unknown function (DUF4397)/LysM domain